MNFRTDRKNAVGMGSGRKGTQHHWMMMKTSLALVVLAPIFVITFGLGLGGTYEEVLAYFQRPFPAIVVGLSMVVGILHFTAEAKDAVEDYVHGTAEKLTLIGLDALAYTLIAIVLFALARMAI